MNTSRLNRLECAVCRGPFEIEIRRGPVPLYCSETCRNRVNAARMREARESKRLDALNARALAVAEVRSRYGF